MSDATSHLRHIVPTLTAAAVALTGVLVTAPTAQAAAAPTISVSKTETMKGKPVKVSGKARATKGTKVTIQQKKRKGWSTVTATRAKANRTYAKQVRFGKPGVKTLRVKVNGKTSPTTRVKVYRWVAIVDDDRLTYDGTGAGSFFDRDGQFTDGKFTARTLQAWGDGSESNWGEIGYTDWGLQRKCVQFKALVGLDDGSDFGAVHRASVLGDGKRLFHKDFTNDESRRISLDVKGVQRLRLQHQVRPNDGTATGSAYTNFGNAKAKCLY